jgi:hypothetical protein
VDAAHTADQSRVEFNYRFHRPWTPPPQNRKRQGRYLLAFSGNPEIQRQDRHSDADSMAQRVIAFAMCRAGQLEQRAAILAVIGQRRAADGMASIATWLREVAA